MIKKHPTQQTKHNIHTQVQKVEHANANEQESGSGVFSQGRCAEATPQQRLATLIVRLKENSIQSQYFARQLSAFAREVVKTNSENEKPARKSKPDIERVLSVQSRHRHSESTQTE